MDQLKEQLDRIRRAACVRKSRRNHPQSHMRDNLKWRYGLSLEHYERMVAKQEGKCALCGKFPDEANPRCTNLSVDHDKDTGMVRGLLCTLCNLGLSNFKESPTILLAAADYLER